jgi:hypothetical protein
MIMDYDGANVHKLLTDSRSIVLAPCSPVTALRTSYETRGFPLILCDGCGDGTVAY